MGAPQMENPIEKIHIQSIKVRNLFGYFNYDIIPEKRLFESEELLIIYGLNGTGKTTILRMLFCLLSTKRGTKNKLLAIPFEALEVCMWNGVKVTAVKKGALGRQMIVSVVTTHGMVEEFEFEKIRDGARICNRPVEEYRYCLDRIGATLYFLPDDRRGLSSISDASDDAINEDASVWFSSHENLKRSEGLRHVDFDAHHLHIEPALFALLSTLRNSVVSASNFAEESASSIYLRVLQQLRNISLPTNVRPESLEHMIGRLHTIEIDIGKYSRYGIFTGFAADNFISLLREASESELVSMQGILAPYIDGIEARIRALREPYDIIHTYAQTLNQFFSRKSIVFDIMKGVTFFSAWGGNVKPEQLSSGEKQLILLLSNAIIARGKSSIFIIDEPELSLNIVWQRQLIEALLKCSRGGGTQFILATHSIELLTQFEQCTTPLNHIAE